jgi:hypothetical protein
MQKQKFDLEKALAGAKLVTRDGREVSDFSKAKGDWYFAKVGGYLYTFSPKDGTHYFGTSILDLFLAEPPTPPEPMLSAEEWYEKHTGGWIATGATLKMLQQYGNYVADFLTKNK